MRATLDFLRSMWILLFRRGPPHIGLEDLETTKAPEVTAPPRTPRKRRPPDTLKSAILDELGTYFPYLSRMRKADHDSYDLYSRTGAQLWSDENQYVDRDGLSPWWKDHRPSFGAIAISSENLILNRKSGKDIHPRFLYFTKYKLPSASIQPMRGGDVYGVTAYFDAMDDKMFKRGVPIEFPVLICNDCSVKILKTLSSRTIIARSKKGGSTSIPQRYWGIPDIFKDWAAHNQESVEDFLKTIFYIVANSYADLSHSTIQIRATKGCLAALFSIDVIKTPEFFADRETVVAAEGHTKKIFHIVRPHSRVTGAVVKMHFRGLRKFTWNGYNIEISVPFRDHLNVAEFDVGAIDEDEAKRTKIKGPFENMKVLGKRLEGWRVAGRGAIEGKGTGR